MNGNKIYALTNTLLLSGLAVLLACTEIDIQDELDEKPILFQATRAFDATRAATTDIQGAVFDKDELINVFITGKSDEDDEEVNIGYPCKFRTLAPKGTYSPMAIDNPDLQPYYRVGTHSSIKYFAAYPANDDVNVTPDITEFTVQYDQTTEKGYKNSDLMMVPPATHNKTAEVLNLPFKHKMAKLIITAIPDGDVQIDDVITLGSIQRGVKIDVANGDFAYDSEHPTEIPVFDEAPSNYKERKIKMLNGGAVLFPPQYIQSAVEFIMITGKDKNGQPQTAQFDIIGKTFKEGHVYKLNLHIGDADFTPNAQGNPHSSAITGWSEDYDELTVTPSGGYSGVNIDDIDGHVSAATSTSGTFDDDGYYVYSTDEDRNPIANCPKPKVTYGDNKIPMTEGTDFNYVYVDNVNAGNNSQVMIVGTGQYAGLAALKPFTIRRAKGKISFPEGSDKTVDFSPDENIGFVKALNTGDGVVTYEVIADGEGESTACASVDPVDGYVILQNVGKCTIKATAAAGRNYDYPAGDNTCTYKIEINAKEVTKDNLKITYSPEDFTYDGTRKELTTLVVADGEHTLVEGTDYEYTLTDKAGRYEGLPLHSGTALLTITGKGNYSEDTKIEIDIPVKQAKPTLTVKETEMALGEYRASAPKDRRKTREATTEEWAQNNIRYSLNATSDLKENTVVSVTNKGLLTGKVLDATIDENTRAAKSTTVYVQVAADNSEYHDWVASDQKSFNVKVYRSDFEFRIKRHPYDDYREPQLHIQADGTPEGAHTVWYSPAAGEWQIDCYGAQGGTTPKYTTERTNSKNYRSTANTAGPKITSGSYNNQAQGGRGAHIAGRIHLPKNMKLHVNLGQKGRIVYPGEQRLRWTTKPSGDAATLKTTNRGTNGGKKNGNLSTVKAGDYEWAAFAWNGGGGMVWGAHNLYLWPWFYVQDNAWVGNTETEARSPAAVASADWTGFDNLGQSYAMFPITGGGGATDVSLAWDEAGGVYTPPTKYTDADRTATDNFTYADNSSTDGSVTLTYDASQTPKYTRSGGGTFQKWITAHNMAPENREKGVGTTGTTGSSTDKASDANRLVGLQWKNPAHLYSRIIVAGGGGGALYYDSSNTYGDGGDGGVWEGTRGLFQDYGEGGYINAAGRGGVWRNWRMSTTASKRADDRTSEYVCSGQATNYPSDIVYNDGPNGGGWSGTDGMFGEGGNTFQPAQGCGGGGGGWYGGGAGNEDGNNGPGGGGSSFIWSDIESVRTYSSSTNTQRSDYNVNHSVSWGTARPLYKNYDYLDADYQSYNGFKPEKWHKKAANFYKFMPTNEYVDKTSTGRNSTLGIYCPFFHQIVTKDTGANAGDGWARITLVEINEDQ